MNRAVTTDKYKAPNAESTERFFLELAESNSDINNLLPFLYKFFASQSGRFTQGFDGLKSDTEYGDMNVISDAHSLKFDPTWIEENISQEYWDSIIKAVNLIEGFGQYSNKILDEHESDNGKETDEDDLLWISLFARFKTILYLFERSIRYLSTISHCLNFKNLFHLGNTHGWEVSRLLENQLFLEGTTLYHKSKPSSQFIKNHYRIHFNDDFHFYLISPSNIKSENIFDIQKICLRTIKENQFNTIVYLMTKYRKKRPPVILCNKDFFASSDTKGVSIEWAAGRKNAMGGLLNKEVKNSRRKGPLTKVLVHLLQQYSNKPRVNHVLTEGELHHLLKTQDDLSETNLAESLENQGSLHGEIIKNRVKGKAHWQKIFDYDKKTQELKLHKNLHLLVFIRP